MEAHRNLKERLTHRYADQVLDLFPDTQAKVQNRRSALIKTLENLIDAYWKEEGEAVINILKGGEES